MALDSKIVLSLILSLIYCLNLLCVYATSYRELLGVGQSVGNSDTLVSKGGNYELRFFHENSENSTKYYVGIRFTKVPNDTIVWVANRDNAFQTSSAFLTIHDDGNIVIIDGKVTYAVTPRNNNSIIGTYATLLDTGNLVLVNNSTQAILWQSFDNPTDTLLPGMNIGYDDITRRNWSLTSWKSVDDPSPGPYTLQYDSYIMSLLLNKGSNVLWIDGSYNISNKEVVTRVGLQFSNTYSTIPVDSNSRLVLEASGDLKYQAWSEESKQWIFLQSSTCATDNSCGIFSICNPQVSDPCQCINGFEPVDAESWKQGNRSAGCVRKKELSCNNNNNSKKDRFLQLKLVNSPPYPVYLQVDAVARCNYACFTNCSCVAYAYYFNGTCMLWNDQLPTLKNTSTDDYAKNNNNLIFFFWPR